MRLRLGLVLGLRVRVGPGHTPPVPRQWVGGEEVQHLVGLGLGSGLGLGLGLGLELGLGLRVRVRVRVS